MSTTATLTTKKFIRDTLFANLPLPFQKLRTYLWLVVFARALGAAGYGEWSLFNTTLSIAVGLASLNLGSAMMRFLSGARSDDELSAAWSTVLCTVLVTAGLLGLGFLVLSTPLAAAIFGQTGSAALICLLGGVLLCDLVYEDVRGFLRSRRLNRTWAFLTLGRLLPETVITIAVGYLSGSVLAVAVAYGACSLAAAMGGVLFLYANQGLRLVRPQWHIFRRYVPFGAALLPGMISYFLSVRADQYLVGTFLGMEQVGIYSATVTIAALVFFFVGPINDVLFPELSALYDQHEAEAFRRRFAGIQKVIFGLSCCFAVVLLVFPGELLALFASGKFAPGARALAIMGCQGLFMGLTLLYTAVLNVQLRLWWSASVWTLMALVILPLDLWLVPRLGIAGAALSQLIAAVGAFAVLVGLNWSLFRGTFSLSWPFQTLAAATLVLALNVLLPHAAPDPLASFLALTLGAALFVAGLVLTRYLRIGEVKMFLAALK